MWLGVGLILVACGALVIGADHGPGGGGAAAEQEVLSRLLDEFSRNRETVATNVEVLHRLEESVNALLAGAPPRETSAPFAVLLTDLHTDPYRPIETQVIDSLLRSRGLNLVTDRELNGWLLRWPLLVNGLREFERALRLNHDSDLAPAVETRFPGVHAEAAEPAGSPRFGPEPVGPELERSLRQRLRLAERALEHCARLLEAHNRILRARESRTSS